MHRFVLALGLLAAGSSLVAEEAPLSDHDAQSALEALEANYFNHDAVNPAAQKQATLRGLIEQLRGGVRIVATKPDEAPAAANPFHPEMLGETVSYLRLGRLERANVTALHDALAGLHDPLPKAFVLDLRATDPSDDFALAAEVAGLFIPKGRVVCTLRPVPPGKEQSFISENDPLVKGTLAVLVSPRTSGAAEMLAASLRVEARALVIGGRTAGEAVQRAEFPLDGGKKLLVAVAEVVMPGGVSIYPDGVAPDLAVALDEKTERELLAGELEKGVALFAFDQPQPHMNEAALVAQTNPEIDQALKAPHTKKQPRDPVIQRALDFVATAAFYQDRLAQ